MRRYFNIFLLYSQLAIEVKSLSVVWFLALLITPLLMLIYWHGAIAAQGGNSILGWTYSNLFSYYLLVALGGSMLIAHIEGDVANDDIAKGELSVYLLQPVSYFKMKFVDELPWRFLQGGLAIITIIIIDFITQGLFKITISPIQLLLALIICVLAYILSFLFKMCLGFLAFWVTEIGGFMEVTEVVMDVCAGIITPLIFLPLFLQTTLSILPFSYIIYYPIAALIGKLNIESELIAILMQVVWIGAFAFIYRIMWNAGRKKYTAVGR